MTLLVRQWPQIFRSWLLRYKGAKMGQQTLIGRGVRIGGPKLLVVGDNVVLWPGAYINCWSEGGVTIGNYTTFHMGLWLDCGSTSENMGPGFFQIGDHCFVGPYAVMGAKGGGIQIGNHVQMGQMVSIHAENHCFDDVERRIDEQGTWHQGVTVENDCWIGSKATILDGVTIGRGSVIGAGSVVTHSIPPYSVAVGNPARVIRKRGHPDVAP